MKEALESQVEKGLEEKRMLEKAFVEALSRYENLAYQKQVLKKELKIV